MSRPRRPMTRRLITLDECLELIAIAERLDNLRALEDLYDDTDYQAELYAENAWLRYAENQGWEEEMRESYIRSGFIARR